MTRGKALGDQPLMLRLDIGMEESDGDGPIVLGYDVVDKAVHRFGIETSSHGSVRQYALGNLVNVAAADERLWLVEVKIVGLVALLPADNQNITKTGGRDQGGRRALALDDRVGCNRGRVQEYVDGPGCNGRLVEQLRQSRHYRVGGLGRRGKNLAEMEAAGFAIL